MQTCVSFLEWDARASETLKLESSEMQNFTGHNHYRAGTESKTLGGQTYWEVEILGGQLGGQY